MLAESWSPNDDGSVWTFMIRQGVKWHDGTDFTAEHVVGALDRLAPTNLAAYIDPGSAVVDEHERRVVTLKNPDGQFPYQVSPYNPQAVITPPDYEIGTLFDQKPNGTSAFKLDTYDLATGANYVRFDDWWGGKAHLDGVNIVFSDDNATQINGLLGGQVDAVIQFAVSDADALFKSDKVTIDSIQGAGHRQIWFNVREGTFSGENGAKIREAVALGIDRQALVDTVLQGRGDIGNDHPIAPVYEYWDSSQPQRERDIEAAKALLEEAGADRAWRSRCTPPTSRRSPCSPKWSSRSSTRSASTSRSTSRARRPSTCSGARCTTPRRRRPAATAVPSSASSTTATEARPTCTS